MATYIKKTIVRDGHKGTRPMTDKEEAEFDRVFDGMDEAFKRMDEAFAALRRWK